MRRKLIKGAANADSRQADIRMSPNERHQAFGRGRQQLASRRWRAEAPSAGGQEADLRQGDEQASASRRFWISPPPSGYARWTGPLLANALGDIDVQYAWRFQCEHNIDLAGRKSWCESNDPRLAAKAADVAGLYVDPPDKAIVLCIDEKLRSRPWNGRKAN